MRPAPYPDLPPFHPDRPGLTAPVPLDPTGRQGPTRGQAHGGRWRRTSRGLYVPTTVDGARVEQRIVEAAAVLPTYGGLTGWAQLRWAGARWFDGLANDGRTPRRCHSPCLSATCVPSPGFRSGPSISTEDELEWLDGLRTTRSVRSLLFEIRMAPSLLAAVVAIDMAAYSDLVSIAELVAFIRDHVGWPGIRQARAACDLADENSWSPREVWLRFLWMCEAGFPRPSMNTPVFDLAGRHVGTPDLLDVEAGAVGEYEGADVHLNPESRHRDLGREDAFRGIGLEYFTTPLPARRQPQGPGCPDDRREGPRKMAAARPAAMDRHPAGLVGAHRHRRAASRAHP